MMEWIFRAADQVDRLAKTDMEYQELARQRAEPDGAYTDLLSRLHADDRELLLEYMDVVGNMQYRMTQLAWLYGKRHPHD